MNAEEKLRRFFEQYFHEGSDSCVDTSIFVIRCSLSRILEVCDNWRYFIWPGCTMSSMSIRPVRKYA